MAVLGGSNSGWLNDDIVNDSGDHHEVSKEGRVRRRSWGKGEKATATSGGDAAAEGS